MKHPETHPRSLTPETVGATPGAGRGDLRVGPLRALPAVLREQGVAPDRVFELAGVSLSVFDDPDNRIPLDDLRRLLSASVDLADCPHLGLLLGSRFELRNLGVLGEVMRNQSTLADALRILVLHLHVQDRIAVPVLLEVGPSRVVLGYSPQFASVSGSEPLLDAAIAVGYGILRELCGAGFAPISVQLAHRPPADPVPYRRRFRSRVRFDAGLSGLSFSAHWLGHRVIGADPVRAMQLARELRGSTAGGPMDFAEEAQRVLHQLLLGGSPSAGALARLFGCSERTLRKHLAAHGTSMRELLARTRFEMAQQLLLNTRLPLSTIAATLCYADSATFSRAFRGWSGSNPRRWRQRHSDSVAR